MREQEKLREREFDSSWKNILEKFFWDFLDFYFPKIAIQIERERGYTFLDKELSKITREAESKNRRVDKLAQVYVKEQGEIWILIHIEVQSYKDTDFALRMYTYNYRLFERYQRPVASLAILTDPIPEFRPSFFEQQVLGETFVRFQYPIAKILDWEGKEKELEENSNPFAIVTLASLKTYEKENEKRFVSKFCLTKLLYEKGYEKATILALYEFLDGIMVLPEKMEIEYGEKVYEYEKEYTMPYITTAERMGMRKASIQSISDVLESRFGNIPDDVSAKLQDIIDIERLRELIKKAATVDSLETFTHFLS